MGRLQRVTCPVRNLSCNFFGLTTNAQSKLVIHDAIFLATCLATLDKEIQVAEDMLHVATSSCNLQWFQNSPWDRCKK